MSTPLSACRNRVISTQAHVVYQAKNISTTSKLPLHEQLSLRATMIVQTASQICVAAWSLQTCLSSLFTGSRLHGRKLMSSEARFENMQYREKILQKLSTLLTKKEKYQSIIPSNKLIGTD